MYIAVSSIAMLIYIPLLHTRLSSVVYSHFLIVGSGSRQLITFFYPTLFIKIPFILKISKSTPPKKKNPDGRSNQLHKTHNIENMVLQNVLWFSLFFVHLFLKVFASYWQIILVLDEVFFVYFKQPPLF